MASENGRNRDPFADVSGNLLLGGLPQGCGPEAVVVHLESLAALGRQVARDSQSLDRLVNEFAQEARSNEQTGALMVDVMDAIRSEGKQLPDNSDFPFSDWLAEHLFDESLVGAGKFGLVLKVDRHDAFAALAAYLWRPPQGTLVDLLGIIPKADRKLWALPDTFDAGHQRRASEISTEHLLFGLHELDRIPWNQYGGLVAWRGATDEYLMALRSLNRHVVATYVLHDWHNSASEDVEWKRRALDDLVQHSLPFAIPPQLATLLASVGRLYFNREFAAAVILSRSVLESAFVLVHQHEKLGPQPNLAAYEKQLRDRKLLSGKTLRDASDVRIWGNKAVHELYHEFSTPVHAARAIKATIAVLAALRPYIAVEATSRPSHPW